MYNIGRVWAHFDVRSFSSQKRISLILTHISRRLREWGAWHVIKVQVIPSLWAELCIHHQTDFSSSNTTNEWLRESKFVLFSHRVGSIFHMITSHLLPMYVISRQKLAWLIDRQQGTKTNFSDYLKQRKVESFEDMSWNSGRGSGPAAGLIFWQSRNCWQKTEPG